MIFTHSGISFVAAFIDAYTAKPKDVVGVVKMMTLLAHSQRGAALRLRYLKLYSH